MLQQTNGDWVLCDFGSVTDKPALYQSSDAVLMGEEVVRKYTTPAYRAPEVRHCLFIELRARSATLPLVGIVVGKCYGVCTELWM